MEDHYKVILFQTPEQLEELEKWNSEEYYNTIWDILLKEEDRKDELISMLKMLKIPIKARTLLEPNIYKITLYVTKKQFDIILKRFSESYLIHHMHNYGINNEEYSIIKNMLGDIGSHKQDCEYISEKEEILEPIEIERKIFMESINQCICDHSM